MEYCVHCDALIPSDDFIDHCLQHYPGDGLPQTPDFAIGEQFHHFLETLDVTDGQESNVEVPGPSSYSEPLPPITEIGCLRKDTCVICGAYFKRKNHELEHHLMTVHPEFYDQVQVGGNVQDGHATKPDIQLKLHVKAHRNAHAEYTAIILDKEDDLLRFFKRVEGSAKGVITENRIRRKNIKVFCQMKAHFRKDNGQETDGAFTSFGHIVLRQSQMNKVWSLMCSKLEADVEEFTNEGSGWKLDAVLDFAMIIGTYRPLFGSAYLATPRPLNKKTRCLLNINNSQPTADGDEKKCFLWSVLAHEAFGGEQFLNDPNRNAHLYNKKPASYFNYRNCINDDGIEYPMTIDKIEKFEKLNPTLSFTVIGYTCDSDKTTEPRQVREKTSRDDKIKEFRKMKSKMCLLYNSKIQQQTHIDLMLLMGPTRNHFILVKNLESLLQDPQHDGRQRKICRNCLQGFTTKTIGGHTELCTKKNMQRTEYPKPRECIEFRNWHKTQRTGFTFYCDFEALLQPLDGGPDINLKTVKKEHHKQSGYSWICVDWKGEIFDSKYYHVENDDQVPAEKMVEEMLDYVKRCRKILDEFQKESSKNMVIDNSALSAAEKRGLCCLCNTSLRTPPKNSDNNIIVRHHMHLPPFNFVGLAHQHCNFQAKMAVQNFTCFYHNGSNYDCHYVVQALGKLYQKKKISKVTVIPKSSEKFTAITISQDHDAPISTKKRGKKATKTQNKKRQPKKKCNKITFIDSLSFTLASLDKMVQQLVKADKNGTKFNVVKQEFQHELSQGADISLLLRKGVFPYSHMKSVDNFSETELPPKHAFYNDMQEEHITDSDYKHAQEVWTSFKCQNLGDYQNLYCRLDVALLACVMEDKRDLLYKEYGLDINHYLTLPSVASDACLKLTKQKIGLITDPTMFLWVEDSIRGGFCGTGSCRSMGANNKYQQHYDPNKPSKYIGYFDANNLYGSSMSQKLPTGNFRWMDSAKLEQIRRNPHHEINKLSTDGDTGYRFEVDLHVPPELHHKFNGFPLAPTKRKVEVEELSKAYQIPLMEELGAKLGNEKLVTDLLDKKKYKVDYRLLQLYIQQGMVVTCVHAALLYDQADWIKPYIDKNTNLRNNADSDFEKEFWKLLTNAIYGKQLENKRNRQNINMVFNRAQALKLLRKPTIQDIISIDEDLSMYVMKRVNVKLDSPILVGSAILDLAKLTMYDVWYNFFIAKYGPDKSNLIYTDTDSVIVSVECEDLYLDMYNDHHYFDMSSYVIPPFDRFQRLENKKVLGKLKDEYANKVIDYAVCPRPKMYWLAHTEPMYDCEGNYKWQKLGETKKAKGISKIAKKQITGEDYIDSLKTLSRKRKLDGAEEFHLFKKQKTVNMKTFKSHKHQVFTEVMTKKSVSAFDSKRFLVDCRFSLAYGHKDIPSKQMCTDVDLKNINIFE